MLLNCSAGEKTLEGPLDCTEIKPVNPKGNQPECSSEGLILMLGYMMRRANSLEKTLMLGKIEGRRRRGWQVEMVGWWWWMVHHRLDGHEFEQTLGDSEGHGSLTCCNPWGCQDRKVWCAAIHGVAKNRAWLSNWKTTTWIKTGLESMAYLCGHRSS